MPVLFSLAAAHLGSQKARAVQVPALRKRISTPPMHGRFPVKFYLIAMLFVIFDVEAASFYPWAVTLKEFKAAGLGAYALMVMMVYVGVSRASATRMSGRRGD